MHPFADSPASPRETAANSLHQLNFDNTFARLPQDFHSPQQPTPLFYPYLVSFNPAAAELIDLDRAESERPDFAVHFSGNRLPQGAEPISMLYAGHQFGHYVQQLGDGRAILLGEVRNRAGELWDVQLKGAGLTPYSRQGDGRAVLRSTIREYLCSEAMHGLGIPTSRALCITGSDEEVYREQIETAAVLTRLAPSHVRFGSFEVFFHRGQHAEITKLADYVIARHFPSLAHAPDKYAVLLDEVTHRTARLMAQWKAVGFAHGVMNTDNMSILGITLDYGPFGFMEAYDPGFVCNHSDHYGRYAFDQQPNIALWNLTRLAHALSPLVPEWEARAVLDGYAPAFYERYIRLMGEKLGLRDAGEPEVPLIASLLEFMEESHVDYSNFFRALGNFDSAPDARNDALRDQFLEREVFDAWARAYRARLDLEGVDDATRKRRMDRVNPKYILRNHLAQAAIERATAHRDYSEIDRLLALLARPFDEQPGMEDYAKPAPAGAPSIEVSCSS
ncbi:MAG TPA: YdiU family protein [Gallionellaceae bacterium]|nr:YdiU family protein [Gallionellaceae bacterium]